MAYQIFDRRISSNIPLPELSVAVSREVDIRFSLLAHAVVAENECRWFHDWRDSDEVISLSCAHVGEDYCIRFHELVDFRISADCKKITAYSTTAIPTETIRHLLIDQVIPRVIAHTGDTVLHCGASCIGGGAVLFLGASGAGKSTLAYSLYREGYSLLSDDCLLLQACGNELQATPAYAGARLWPDSLEALYVDDFNSESMAHYSGKRRLKLSDPSLSCAIRVPVTAIFLLDTSPEQDDQELRVLPMSGATNLVEMLKNTFQLDVSDRGRIARQFEQLGDIVASSIAVFSLKYPHRHDILPRVHKEILATLLQCPECETLP